MTRINVGCGATPTREWKNYDNSWSVRLAGIPVLASLLGNMGVLTEGQQDFIAVARRLKIRWADASQRIPEPDGSVEVVYSSHMLEHLDQRQARRFLAEVRRILVPGGIIRLAVPDVHYHVVAYLQHKDADRFIHATRLSRASQQDVKTFRSRLKFFWIGERGHQWMYDGESLCKILASAGFQNLRVMEAGTTMIHEPGPLDLRERESESVYVEAVNP